MDKETSEPYRMVFILIRRFWSEYFQSEAPTKHQLFKLDWNTLLKECVRRNLYWNSVLIRSLVSLPSPSVFKVTVFSGQLWNYSMWGKVSKRSEEIVLCACTCVLVYLRVGSHERIKEIFLDWCKITSIHLIFLRVKKGKC